MVEVHADSFFHFPFLFPSPPFPVPSPSPRKQGRKRAHVLFSSSPFPLFLFFLSSPSCHLFALPSGSSRWHRFISLSFFSFFSSPYSFFLQPCRRRSLRSLIESHSNTLFFFFFRFFFCSLARPGGGVMEDVGHPPSFYLSLHFFFLFLFTMQSRTR